MLAARGVKPDDPAACVKIPAGPQIKPGQEHAHVALAAPAARGCPLAADGKDAHSTTRPSLPP